jgi:hypothetical protein
LWNSVTEPYGYRHRHCNGDSHRDGNSYCHADSYSNSNSNAYAKPDGNSNSNGNAYAKPDGDSDSDTDTWTEDYTVAKAAFYAAAATIVSLESVL